MHVHRPLMDLSVSNLYGAFPQRRLEEAQAAEVRRKLAKAAAGPDGETADFGGLLVEGRSGEGSGQGGSTSRDKDEKQAKRLFQGVNEAGAAAGVEDSGDGAGSLSLWA